MRPYRPNASAKIRMRIMPTKSFSCCPIARTPASPTIPIAMPAARPLQYIFRCFSPFFFRVLRGGSKERSRDTRNIETREHQTTETGKQGGGRGGRKGSKWLIPYDKENKPQKIKITSSSVRQGSTTTGFSLARSLAIRLICLVQLLLIVDGYSFILTGAKLGKGIYPQ